MKRYKIVEPIMLDFLTPQDSVTMIYDDGIVEWNEKNAVWYIDSDDKKIETINTGNLIQKYIEDERLIEIP